MQVILRTYDAVKVGATRIADEAQVLYTLDTSIAQLIADRETDQQEYHFSLAEVSDEDLCSGLQAASCGDHWTKWPAKITSHVLQGGDGNALPVMPPGYVRAVLCTSLLEVVSPFRRKTDMNAVIFPLGKTVRELLAHRESTQYGPLYYYVAGIAESHLCQGLTAASMGNVHTEWEVALQTSLLFTPV